MLRSLATRNLLRGYLLSIPTGQAMADAMGVSKLTAAELQQDNTPAVNAALQNGGFLQSTPLFYYVLEEAEVRATATRSASSAAGSSPRRRSGSCAGTRTRTWVSGRLGPSKGVKLPGNKQLTTIRDLFAFADLAA